MCIFQTPSRLSVLLFCLCLTFLGGCNSDSGSASQTEKQRTPQEVPAAGEKQCYNYIVNGDTIIVTLNWLDSIEFTGSMVYRLKEKDNNIGTLKGRRKDSILLADYRFSSEGGTSTREVAFKKIADYVVEGFGDVTPDSSGFHFTHPDSLTFDLNRKLQRVNCL